MKSPFAQKSESIPTQTEVALGERFTVSNENTTVLGRTPIEAEEKYAADVNLLGVTELPRTFSRAFLEISPSEEGFKVTPLSSNNKVWSLRTYAEGENMLRELPYMEAAPLDPYEVLVIENASGFVFIQRTNSDNEFKIVTPEQNSQLHEDFVKSLETLHHDKRVALGEAFTVEPDGVTLLGRAPRYSDHRLKNGSLSYVSVPELSSDFSRAFLAVHRGEGVAQIGKISESCRIWVRRTLTDGQYETSELELRESTTLQNGDVVGIESDSGQRLVLRTSDAESGLEFTLAKLD